MGVATTLLLHFLYYKIVVVIANLITFSSHEVSFLSHTSIISLFIRANPPQGARKEIRHQQQAPPIIHWEQESRIRVLENNMAEETKTNKQKLHLAPSFLIYLSGSFISHLASFALS
jgi:hypothetical protein